MAWWRGRSAFRTASARGGTGWGSRSPRRSRERATTMSPTRRRSIRSRATPRSTPCRSQCANARRDRAGPARRRGGEGGRSHRARDGVAGPRRRLPPLRPESAARVCGPRPVLRQRHGPAFARRGLHDRCRLRVALGSQGANGPPQSEQGAARQGDRESAGHRLPAAAVARLRHVERRARRDRFGEASRGIPRVGIARVLPHEVAAPCVRRHAGPAGRRGHRALHRGAAGSIARPRMILQILREHLGLLMLATLVALIMTGFPVAFTLMGTAVGFALLGNALGFFDAHWLSALALRLTGLMNDDLLQAVPGFIYLGVILQRTTLSTELLGTIAAPFGGGAGGLGNSGHPPGGPPPPPPRRGGGPPAPHRPPPPSPHVRAGLHPR